METFLYSCPFATPSLAQQNSDILLSVGCGSRWGDGMTEFGETNKKEKEKWSRPVMWQSCCDDDNSARWTSLFYDPWLKWSRGFSEFSPLSSDYIHFSDVVIMIRARLTRLPEIITLFSLSSFFQSLYFRRLCAKTHFSFHVAARENWMKT